ncbi:MAG: hypothetical protein ACAI44_21270 [Candidatus Sericytochromatia bacterium]
MKLPKNVQVGAGWNEGGTLHKATIREWHRGKWGDGLATCSDWVVTFRDLEGKPNADFTGRFRSNVALNKPDDLLAYSLQLLQAVTRGTEKRISEAGGEKMSAVAMAAAAKLGWLTVEEVPVAAG